MGESLGVTFWELFPYTFLCCFLPPPSTSMSFALITVVFVLYSFLPSIFVFCCFLPYILIQFQTDHLQVFSDNSGLFCDSSLNLLANTVSSTWFVLKCFLKFSCVFSYIYYIIKFLFKAGTLKIDMTKQEFLLTHSVSYKVIIASW